MAAGNPVIELCAISKTYPGGSVPALAIADLAIGKGEFFSILGPSGSGKTTALRLIAGFEKPDRGKIFIEGVDVTETPAHGRDVNTVFQSYALFPHMTVRQNVEYPLKMASVDKSARRSRALDALAMVEMSVFENRYPHQMSGGQRQRVALARAFVGRPKILLLDEPLSALDLNLRHQMQHLLVELQRELGLTFVYVTHDQGEALSMSSRVAVVSEGRVQQLDAPQDIYYTPQNQFIAQFIGKSNIFPIEVAAMGGSCASSINAQPFAVPDGCRPGAARLSMRFEAISVTPAGGVVDKPVRMSGVVSDVLFLGSSIEVKVKCGESEVIAVLPSRKDVYLRPFQNVVISFNPAEGHVFNVG